MMSIKKLNSFSISLLFLFLIISTNYADSKIIKPVNISKYFNNDGIASKDNMKHGDFDTGGYTYPQEELPAIGSVLKVKGIKFLFSSHKQKPYNNIQCKGETLKLPGIKANIIYFLGASHGGNFKENFNLVYKDGTEELIQVGLSDWCALSQFGELIGIKANYRYSGENKEELPCVMWVQEIILKHPEKKVFRLILPTKENMHIFAITLSRSKKSLKASRLKTAVSVDNNGIFNLKKLFNNQGLASEKNKMSGDFDGGNYSYPSEQLPTGKIKIDNIYFYFHNTGKDDDNIKCMKQKLVMSKKIKGNILYILGSAEYGNHKGKLRIIYTDGRSQYVDFGLTDWCSQKPAYGEVEALETDQRYTPKGVEDLKTRIWVSKIHIKKKNIKAIVLPANSHMHIFAVTIK